jgi:hypothetical protein
MEPAAQHRGELCLGGGKLGNMQRGLRQQGVDHLAGRHGMYFVFSVAVDGHVIRDPATSSNGVHATVSRRQVRAMFGTSVARKTQWRGPLALQII